MPTTPFKPADLLEALDPPVAVKIPLSDLVAETRTRAMSGEANARFGVWECSPGVWRRQVLQAEFCLFESGRGAFEPDEGPVVQVEAGVAVYFPANSTGVWRIEETLRKTFIVFDQPTGQ